MTLYIRLILGHLVFIFVLTPLLPRTSFAQNGESSSSVESRRQRLLSLFDEEWQYELRTNPELATQLGDNRYNDHLSDSSPEFFKADVEQKRGFLSRFQAINPAGLSRQDALSLELMIRRLREEIEGAPFKQWEMPVNQMGGLHLELPDLVVLTPFNSVADYDNYLARLHQIPHAFDQATANMRQGMRDGLMPPRYILEKVAAEADDVASKTGEDSPFAKPVKDFPSSVPAPEQKRLRDAVLTAIASQVVPAYQRFASFVRTEYAPHGRTDPGVWALPDGEARYRFAIRHITTTDMTPEEIHALGLKQIDEIESEMLAVAHQLGFKDLASLNDHIRNDRRFYATSGQQVLDLVRELRARHGTRTAQTLWPSTQEQADSDPHGSLALQERGACGLFGRHSGRFASRSHQCQ
jgi:uncharacterized protein (DUF885 family)